MPQQFQHSCFAPCLVVKCFYLNFHVYRLNASLQYIQSVNILKNVQQNGGCIKAILCDKNKVNQKFFNMLNLEKKWKTVNKFTCYLTMFTWWNPFVTTELLKSCKSYVMMMVGLQSGNILKQFMEKRRMLLLNFSNSVSAKYYQNLLSAKMYCCVKKSFMIKRLGL